MSLATHVRKDVGRAFRDWRGLAIALSLPMVILAIYHLLDLAPLGQAGRDPDAFILVVCTSFPALLASSTALVEERRLGTFARLARTPARTIEVVAGKAIGAAAVLVLQVGILLLVAPHLLGKSAASVTHDAVGLFALLFLNALAATSAGLLISSLVSTEAQAMQLTALVLLTMLVLSGFLEPLDEIPRVGGVARVLPMASGYSGLKSYFAYSSIVGPFVILAVDCVALVLLAALVARLRR